MPTSYRVKEVKIGFGEVIRLPYLQRKHNRRDIIRNYVAHYQNDTLCLSQNTIYSLLNNFTATDEVSLYAIDYVTSQLLN